MRKPLLAPLALLVLLPAAASAEIRSATVTDPQDATPTVSGVPNNPDISRVDASYDTSGSFALKVSFYNSVYSLDTSQNYGFAGSFNITDGCSYTAYGGLAGQHHVRNDYAQFFNRGTVSGFDGYLPFTNSVAADGRSITVTGSSQALANHDWRCFAYKLTARRRSTISNPSSDYDASCDCWYVHGVIDVLGVPGPDPINGDAVHFFDGFSPVEPSPETPQADYRLRRVKPICGGVEVSYWRLRPDRVNGTVQPFDGRLVYLITGKGPDRQRSSRPRSLGAYEYQRVRLRGLKEGRHKLQTYYTGDSYRGDSEILKKRFRVKC